MKATLQAGWGYWDVTSYPYGGSFKRPKQDTEVEIIEGGAVQNPDEKRVRFADGRQGVVKSASLKIAENQEK